MVTWLEVTAADIARVEFFLVLVPEVGPDGFMPACFFADRVLVPPPTGRLAPEPRFLFLMTSVFKLRGRTTP